MKITELDKVGDKRQKEIEKTQTNIENDLRRCIDDKVREVLETNKRITSDNANRITKLQNEMKLGMLDDDQFAFFKIVQKDWTKMMDRSKALEKQLSDISSNQDGLLKRMNTLNAKHIGTLSDGINSGDKSIP